MKHVKEKALSTAPNPPKWWFRYIDDSHVCIKREHVDEFHAHLNSINSHIKFTIEIESEVPLPFSIPKQPDKKMARSPCLFTGKLPILTVTLILNHSTIPSINARSYALPWTAQRTFLPPRRNHLGKLSE